MKCVQMEQMPRSGYAHMAQVGSRGRNVMRTICREPQKEPGEETGVAWAEEQTSADSASTFLLPGAWFLSGTLSGVCSILSERLVNAGSAALSFHLFFLCCFYLPQISPEAERMSRVAHVVSKSRSEEIQ